VLFVFGEKRSAASAQTAPGQHSPGTPRHAAVG
jgi:hypothetical protein